MSARKKLARVALALALVLALGAICVIAYLYALRSLRIPWRTLSCPGPIVSLAFSPSGDELAAMTAQATVRVFSVKTGEILQSFEAGRDKGVSLGFMPDGEHLACTAESSLKLWDWRQGKVVRTFEGHPHEMGKLAISPQGDRIAAGASDTSVRLWESGGNLLAITGLSDVKRLDGLGFSSDGSRLLVSGRTSDGDLDVATLTTAPLAYAWHAASYGTDPRTPFAVCPARDLYAVGIPFGAIDSLKERVELDPCDGLSLAFSQDGDELFGVAESGRLRVWSTATGKTLRQSWVAINVEAPPAIAASPRGDLIATGSGDGILQLWWYAR